MAVRGNEDPNDNKKHQKDRRNKILLASLIVLALLSLFIFLGNPGLWTPDKNDEPEAEATDDAGDVRDSENSTQELVAIENETGSGVALTNYTSTGSGADAVGDSNGGSGGFGYVIIYSNSNNNSGSGSSGGHSRGAGGGSGGSNDNQDGTDTNLAPVAKDLTASTIEDIPLALQMEASDADGDSIEYSLSSNPAHGLISSFNSSTGAALYTPESNFFGSDIFTYIVTDSYGASDLASVSITITPVNDAPLASNYTGAMTDEDQPVNIDLNLSVSDSDESSTITVVNITQPSYGSLVLYANNTVTYVPNPDFYGQDGFMFRVTDGLLISNFANVSIMVNPVNDAPRPQNITSSTPEDTPVGIVLINSSSDVDGDVSGLQITQLPSNGTVSISADNRTVTYIPNQDFEGSDGFEYIISDGVSSATGTVNIAVTPVNDPPGIDSGALGSVTVDEDGSTVIDIISNVFDPERDDIAITNVTQPAYGSVTLNPDGTVTYTSDPDFNGVDNFEFTVDDGNGGSSTGTVIVTVIPFNDAPVAGDGALSGNEDTTTSYQLNSTDADGDALTFTLISLPSHGTAVMVDNSSGMLEYTPDLNYNGPDSLTFQTTDDTAFSTIATLSIAVIPVNDDPVVNDDNFLGVEDSPLEFDVLANDYDVDADELTVQIISVTPTNGIATINPDNSITYTPDLDFSGADSFEYTITDGNGGTETGTVMISIDAINDSQYSGGETCSNDDDEDEDDDDGENGDDCDDDDDEEEDDD